MNEHDQVQVFLSDEYDKPLHAALQTALMDLGASLNGCGDWSLAGSQELWQMDVVLDEKTIHIESETYVDLSITGSAAIVEKIHACLRKKKTR